MSANLRPARAVSPGRIIRRELKTRGWTQKDLAAITERPEQTISQIVNGHKQITPETALQMAAAFGTSADFWLTLEINYQIQKIHQEHDSTNIERKSRLYSLVPLTELLRRGWIEAQETLADLEQAVCEFLEIATPAETPQLAVNFRHSQAYTPEVAAEIVWVKRVERLACEQAVAAYSRERFAAAIPELLSLAVQVEDVTNVPGFLQSLGVRFVIVPHLPHTYLDGATFVLAGHPVVALTLRHDRIDNFWFTLLHELAHIVLEHPGLYLDNLDEEAEGTAEIEANQLAQTWLIAPEAVERFVASTKPYFSHSKIRAFAADQNLHPGIIVGQLHHDKIIEYRHSRASLVKVSPYLTDWIDVSQP